MRYKLGKKPARKGAVTFRFTSYFDRQKLPTPPLVFGHERIGTPWGMLANDVHRNCVFAGAAHEHMIWTHEGGATAKFRDSDVLADYGDVTGFDPAKPDTDQGTDMSQAAEYRRTTGIRGENGKRHKIDAYVALRPGKVEDAILAAYLMGAAGLGVQLPSSALDQFDAHQPWTVVKRSETEGGHYIPLIGRNRNGHLLVVTWGRVHAMTPEFYARYCDESLAYLSLEILRDKVSPEGFDAITLQEHLNALRHH